MSINCPDCGRDIPTIEWAQHKTFHKRPSQTQMFPKSVMKAAKNLTDTIAKAGGGSIGISYGGKREEIISIPPQE